MMREGDRGEERTVFSFDKNCACTRVDDLALTLFQSLTRFVFKDFIFHTAAALCFSFSSLEDSSFTLSLYRVNAQLDLLLYQPTNLSLLFGSIIIRSAHLEVVNFIKYH